MKRVLKLVLAAIMIVNSTMSVFADAAVPSLSAAESTGIRGSSITTFIEGYDFENIGALGLEIYYDSEVLSFVSLAPMDLISSYGDYSYDTNGDNPGVIITNYLFPEGLSGSGDIFALTFNINSNTTVEHTTVTIAVGNVYDKDLNPVNLRGTNYKINISHNPVNPETMSLYCSTNLTVQQDDVVDIDLWTYNAYNMAASDYVIEYDSDLLRYKGLTLGETMTSANGALYDINDTHNGYIKVSYANIEGINGSINPILRVSFDVIADENIDTQVKLSSESVYNASLEPINNYSVNSLIHIVKKEIIEEKLKITATSSVNSDGTVNVVFNVPGETNLAAADFVVSFNNEWTTCESVSKLDTRNTIVSNIINDEGQVKFSYVNTNGGLQEDTDIVKLVFKPLNTECTNVPINFVVKYPVNDLDEILDLECVGTEFVMHKFSEEQNYENDVLCEVCGELIYPKLPLPFYFGVAYEDQPHGSVTASLDIKEIYDKYCGAEALTDTEITLTAVPETGYTINGWYLSDEYSTKPAGEAISNDLVYQHVLSIEDLNKYFLVVFELSKHKVKWLNYDNTELKSDSDVSYGSMPSYDGTTPKKPSDDEYHYVFTGWDPEIIPVVEDVIYTAKYESVKHSWENPIWSWDELTSASVTLTCNVCNHQIEMDAEITSNTEASTCEEPGMVTYTATVVYDGKTYTDVKTEELPVLGHDWNDPTYVWSQDNKTVTATRTCKRNAEHVESEIVNTTRTVTKQATCEENGETTYSATFENSAFSVEPKVVADIPALGHDWGEPTYEWSGDNSTVTATRVCQRNENHIETETANTTSKITLEPTCETKGKTTYTATFTNEAFTTQSKTLENVEALGHDWNDPTYVWSQDNKTVTATRTCKRNAEHVESETVNTTRTVTKQATCEENGETTYSATFENSAFSVEPKTVDDIPATGHKWSEPVWSWNEDHTQATATFTCENDPTDKRTVSSNDVEVSEVPATYEADGSRTYTVTVIDPDGKPHTETYTEVIPQLGYEFEFDHFEWAQDYSSAVAIFKDEKAGKEKEVAATVTSATTQPTCEVAGKTVYTAKVVYDSVEYTEVKEVPIPALGHDWGEPTYEWSGDNSTVTATRVCQRNENHIETETANTTSKITLEPTCETKGKTTYTATFTNEAFTTQSKTLENVEALGHDWNDPTYVWSQDNKTVTATRTCKRNAEHVESETVNTTRTVTKQATCEENGETTYSATFENSAFSVEPKTVDDIPATGHKWSEPVWSWNEDHTQATATFTCENDPTDKRTVSSNDVEVSEVPATYEADGSRTYTVTVIDPDGKPHTETYTEVIPQLGYEFEFDHFEWAQDYSSAVAIFKDDASGATREIIAVITSQQIDPTCEAPGRISYTATVSATSSFDGNEHTDSKEVIIPALGHSLKHVDEIPAECEKTGIADHYECDRCHKVFKDAEGKIEVTETDLTIPAKGHDWSEWTVTKARTCTETGEETRTCSRCGKTETRTVEATGHKLIHHDAIAATCESDGKAEYWECSVCHKLFSDDAGKTEITEASLLIPALGHDWGEPVWNWNEDHTKATATFTCKNDPSHTYTTEESKSTVKETPATYEADGKKEYTVTVTGPDGIEYTETYEETIPALKYYYQYQGTEWADDNSKAYAVFHDEKSGKTEKVEAVVSVKTTQPTCTEDGKTVYTATISSDKSLDGKEHTETKETVIPKTGHSYGEWVYNGTEHTHTHTCANDPSHTETQPCEFDEGVTEGDITTYTCKVCGGTYTVKEEGPVNPEVDGVIRVAGANRFGTSQAIASVYRLNNNVEKLDAVILANGDNFADALAGSYLAAEKNAPIIITRVGKEAEVNAYIRSILNKGGTIYVLGGTAAVPESCLNGLTGKGYDIKRLWGSNRYLTNLDILNHVGIKGDRILVATGNVFADSLSASATGLPMLLVRDDGLTDQQKEFLSQNKGKEFIILGGNNAVKPIIESQLKSYGSVRRIMGANRAGTSIEIAKEFFPEAKQAVVAYSHNFPDGLCGGPLAHQINAPLILTRDNDADATAAYLKSKGIKNGYVLGGTSVVSDALVRKLFAMKASDKIIEFNK